MTRPYAILASIGIGTFMSALDGSVVNVVLPLLREQLRTDVATIEWVATVYLLVVSALLLGVGRAGDLYGQKRLYIGGFVLFVAGSATCGLARGVGMLIAMRGLQAVGAAMLFASGPAILTRAFPPERRGRALGALATFTYLGLTVGPALGGWLAHAYGWRSVFYINIPIGLIGIVMAWRALPHDAVADRGEPFDLAGAALFTTGLVALLIALNQGHAWGWSAPLTLGLIFFAVFQLVLFLSVERQRSHPMLDLSLFRNRVFSAATLAALLNYICVYSVLFVLPFVLMQGRGLSVQRTGLILTAQPIVMAIVAPLSGALSDRIGSRILAALGMFFLFVGLLTVVWVASLTPWLIAAGLAIIGLGVGLFVSPNNSALMGAAPPHRQGIAAGVLATARNLGMVLGVGIAGAVLTTYLAQTGYIVAGAQAALGVAAAIAAVGMVVAAFSESPGAGARRHSPPPAHQR
ncbi:MAG TPA: MFS transporter [Thermoanaerobaculia bacterium]|jgi:EmrB/QacA subfamily drug resistance transporter|nr:MFS transporter [Thermoanaerobaculia bacterium]